MPLLSHDTYKRLQTVFEGLLSTIDQFYQKITPAHKALLLEQMLVLAPEQARAFLDKLNSHFLAQPPIALYWDDREKQINEINKVLYALKMINDLAHNSKITMRNSEKVTYQFIDKNHKEHVAIEHDALLAMLDNERGAQDIEEFMKKLIHIGRITCINEILQKQTDAIHGFLAYGSRDDQYILELDEEDTKEEATAIENLKKDVRALVLTHVHTNLDNQADELLVAEAKGKFLADISYLHPDFKWRSYKFGNLMLDEIQDQRIRFELAPGNNAVIYKFKAIAAMQARRDFITVLEAELENDLQSIQALQKKLNQPNLEFQQELLKLRMLAQNTSEYKANKDIVDAAFNHISKELSAEEQDRLTKEAELKPDYIQAKAWLEQFKNELAIKIEQAKPEILQKKRQQLLAMKKEYIKKRHALKIAKMLEREPRLLLQQLTYYFQPTDKIIDGKKIVQMPGGGNCLFNAAYIACKMANVLSVEITKPQDIRAAVVKILRAKLEAANLVYAEISNFLHVNQEFEFINGVFQLKDGSPVNAEVAGITGELANTLQEAIAFKNQLQAAIAKHNDTFHLGLRTETEYLQLIQQDGSWAGDLEASVLADVLDCQVKIHTDQSNQNYGSADKPVISLHHKGYSFSLLTEATKETIHKAVEADGELLAMVPICAEQDNSAAARKKAADNDIGGLEDAKIEAELNGTEWLKSILDDYQRIKANMSLDEQMYWEETFYLLELLHTQGTKEAAIKSITDKWQKRIVQTELFFRPTDVDKKYCIPFHVENYVRFNNGEPDPTVLNNTIRSLHKDLLCAYKAAKKSNSDDTLLKLFKSSVDQVCLEARVRAIQEVGNQLAGNITFEQLVGLTILKAYEDKVVRKYGDTVYNENKLMKDEFTYVEDICEFAWKYFAGDMLHHYKPIAAATKKLEETLSALAYQARRPDGVKSIFADEHPEPGKDKAAELAELTDKEIEAQLEELEPDFAGIDKALLEIKQDATADELLSKIATSDSSEILTKIIQCDNCKHQALIAIAAKSVHVDVLHKILAKLTALTEQEPRQQAATLLAVIKSNNANDAILQTVLNQLLTIKDEITVQEKRAILFALATSNKAASDATLRQILNNLTTLGDGDDVDKILQAILKNNATSLALALQVIQNPAADALVLSEAYNVAARLASTDPALACDLALKIISKEKTNADTLTNIINNPCFTSGQPESVFLQVAAHENADDAVLWNIANRDSTDLTTEVLLAAAQNNNASSLTLSLINNRTKGRESFEVCLAVINNKNADVHVLYNVFIDNINNLVTRERKISTNILQAVLTRLSTLKTDHLNTAILNKALASEYATQDIVQQIVTHKHANKETWLAAAKIVQLEPAAILAVIAAIKEKEDADILDTIAGHQNYNSDACYLAMASNALAPDNILRDIALRTTNKEVLAVIAKHTNATEETRNLVTDRVKQPDSENDTKDSATKEAASDNEGDATANSSGAGQYIHGSSVVTPPAKLQTTTPIFKQQEKWDYFCEQFLKTSPEAKRDTDSNDKIYLPIKDVTSATTTEQGLFITRSEDGNCTVAASNPDASKETITRIVEVAQKIAATAEVASSNGMEMVIYDGTLKDIQELFQQAKAQLEVIITIDSKRRAEILEEDGEHGIKFLTEYDAYTKEKFRQQGLQYSPSQPDAKDLRGGGLPITTLANEHNSSSSYDVSGGINPTTEHSGNLYRPT